MSDKTAYKASTDRVSLLEENMEKGRKIAYQHLKKSDGAPFVAKCLSFWDDVGDEDIPSANMVAMVCLLLFRQELAETGRCDWVE